MSSSCRTAVTFLLLTTLSLRSLVSATATVQFSDATSNSKLTFTHQNSPTSSKYLPETMSGGVALFDYDNDGRLDLFFTNGAKLEDPMPPGKKPDKSDGRYWNRLYHQDSDGTFSDVTEKAGVSGLTPGFYSMGIAVGDFDNDGFADLYVTGLGGNVLYRNNGNGTFADVTKKSGTAAEGWSTSAGFFDYNNDGKLDLFVCRYLTWVFEPNKFCGERLPGRRAYCHPDNYSGITNILYRNNGDGTFTDVSREAKIANPEGKALGVAFADYDNDGWMDIYVANDSVQCFLYRNKGDGTFSDESLRSGAGYNDDGKTFAGMGTDFADYDNDGRPDIMVSVLSNETYPLFRNNGDQTFSDLTAKSGLGRATLLYSGWGTKFIDYDNDGWKDIFVAQGHVMDTIQLTSGHLTYLQPPLLLKNVSGTFESAKSHAGNVFIQNRAGRGAAFGDIDNDGDIDVVVANCGQKAYILRNDGGNRNAWLRIKTEGTRSNRDGIGTVVAVTQANGPVQHYTVQTAGSYQSASDKRLLIGLGADTLAKTVEVQWPSGAWQRFENVKANQTLELKEPAK